MKKTNNKNEYTKKEEQALKMFKNLRSHIGENVTCKSFWYGVPYEEQGKLKEVNYFGNVLIGSSGIPFVGYGSAITSILLDETGEILYNNPYIEDGYDRRRTDDIENSKRMIFGNEVVNKQAARRIKREEDSKRLQEHADLQAKKSKYKLMKDGLSLIKAETTEEWLEFVNNNTNTAYSACIVKATILMMKKFEAGISFEDAENQVYNEELGLTGFMAGATANALSHFAREGEEYRKHWNKRYGVADAKETVNPAILTLSPKNINE